MGERDHPEGKVGWGVHLHCRSVSGCTAEAKGEGSIQCRTIVVMHVQSRNHVLRVLARAQADDAYR